MASYRGHLMLAAPLGAGYGALWLLRPELDWGPAFLGAGLTTVGGLLPDLDSDSGVPVRELFGLAATASAVLLFQPLKEAGIPLEHSLVFIGLAYFFIRYVLSDVFRRMTVHRGMYHSLPAMVIAGLIIFLLYPKPDLLLRVYLAGGVMLGFLSHLVLDEIYAVDFMGITVRFNKFAGSALKFTSPSSMANLTTYALLGLLGYLAYQGGLPEWLGMLPQQWNRPALTIPEHQPPRLP